ncbi:hypothetical protein [Amycolatopsis thermoflava]
MTTIGVSAACADQPAAIGATTGRELHASRGNPRGRHVLGVVLSPSW